METSSSRATGPDLIPVGHSLSLLLLIMYLLCVGFVLLTPVEFRMYEAWAPLPLGFEWLTWPGFLLGLIESDLYGWYIALVFVPLYRWYSARSGNF